MFAAILFCGAMTNVFTACGSDDDDKDKKPTEQKDDNKTPTATKGDVTLTFVAQPKSLQYFEYDFKYVDAKGNSKTLDFDQDTQSNSTLDDVEIGFFRNCISVVAENPRYQDMSNPIVYRVELKDQPIGNNVTYTTTCHVKEGATISDSLFYAYPMVIPTLKMENSQRVLASSVYRLSTWKIAPEKWQEYIQTVEGKTIGTASGSVSLSE